MITNAADAGAWHAASDDDQILVDPVASFGNGAVLLNLNSTVLTKSSYKNIL